MSWRLAPSLVICRNEINARFPGRDRASDGSIGDPAHAARKSGHNPDKWDIVRAIDIDEDLDGNTLDSGRDAWVVAETLRQSRDPRILFVIYEGLMFSSYAAHGIAAWTWRAYTGSNLHEKHVHIEIKADMPSANSTAYWFPASWRGQVLPPSRPFPLPAPMPRGVVNVNVKVLKSGDKGGAVTSLQALLVEKAGQYVGAAGPDGDFGRATHSAVVNVQRFFGLKVDGIVGAKTWTVLFL